MDDAQLNFRLMAALSSEQVTQKLEKMALAAISTDEVKLNLEKMARGPARVSGGKTGLVTGGIAGAVATIIVAFVPQFSNYFFFKHNVAIEVIKSKQESKNVEALLKILCERQFIETDKGHCKESSKPANTANPANPANPANTANPPPP
jgi:hypothetical protein